MSMTNVFTRLQTTGQGPNSQDHYFDPWNGYTLKSIHFSFFLLYRIVKVWGSRCWPVKKALKFNEQFGRHSICMGPGGKVNLKHRSIWFMEVCSNTHVQLDLIGTQLKLSIIFRVRYSPRWLLSESLLFTECTCILQTVIEKYLCQNCYQTLSLSLFVRLKCPILLSI